MSDITNKDNQLEATIPSTITNDDHSSTTLNEDNLKIDNEEEDEVDDGNVTDALKVSQTPFIEPEQEDKIEPTPLASPSGQDNSNSNSNSLSKDSPGLEEEDVSVDESLAETKEPKQEDSKTEEEEKIGEETEELKKEESKEASPIVNEPLEEEDNEEDEEEAEEEEEEGETRCICGDLDPPDELGLFIQCEQCGVWQHGYCVGITNDDTPDKYWCEQCRPDLHRLYVTDLGENRSIYKPVQGLRRQKKRLTRQSSSLSSSNGKKNKSTASEESITPSPPTLSQSTNENENPSHVSSQTSNNNATTLTGARPSRSNEKISTTTTTNTTSMTNATEDKDQTSENTLSNQTHNKSQVDNSSSNGDEPSSTPYEEDDRRLQDRKRATFLAREEKQYQRMLEKAIKESKRASGDSGEDIMMDEDDVEDEDDNDTASTVENSSAMIDAPSNTEQNNRTDEIKEPKPVIGKKLSTVKEELDPSGPTKDSIRSNTPDQLSEASNTSLKIVPTPVRKSQRGVKRPRRATTPTDRILKGSRRGKSARTGNDNNHTEAGSTQGNASKTNSDVTLEKPVKPRLPPARTTLNEMRRRTSAILEFISRTQWELSEDQQTKEDFTKFVENSEFINKVNGVYDKYNESLSLMDDLTRNLLLWEQKYSFNKNNNTNNDDN